MIRKAIFTILAACGLCANGFAAAESKSSVGIVNFTTCVTESKLGKQEQASFNSLQTQLTSLIQDTDKQLQELSGKFNDSEYMDSLSPQAEEEMKNRYAVLSEEKNRYQNQFYQVMNQAERKLVQTISTSVNAASEVVAKQKKFSLVINKDLCFFTNTALDVSNLVIAEMDKEFESNQAVSPAAVPASDK